MPLYDKYSSIVWSFSVISFTKLQSILDAVDNTLNAKIKADAVKQEKDRHEEMLRSALGAVAALNNVDGIGTGTWRTFMDNIAANPALATLYP